MKLALPFDNGSDTLALTAAALPNICSTGSLLPIQEGVLDFA
jgi:hypothetical protein